MLIFDQLGLWIDLVIFDMSLSCLDRINALLSGTIRCSRLILYFPFLALKPGVSPRYTISFLLFGHLHINIFLQSVAHSLSKSFRKVFLILMESLKLSTLLSSLMLSLKNLCYAEVIEIFSCHILGVIFPFRGKII